MYQATGAWVADSVGRRQTSALPHRAESAMWGIGREFGSEPQALGSPTPKLFIEDWGKELGE